MKKIRIKKVGRILLSLMLITSLVFSGIIVTDIRYNYVSNTASAATLTGADGQEISKPAFNEANIPNRDNSGTVSYWYAGNEFHALNQITDGVKQSGSGTDGHIKVYSDSNAARLVEEYSYNYTGKNQMAVKGYFPGGREFTTFTKEDTNPTSDTVWELMDTDAVWDDQYLFAQYYTRNTGGQTAPFTPTILTNVENWYKNGFSYDGTQNSRPSVSAPNPPKSWFSSAEQEAVKSATVKTDGVTDFSNTNGNDSITAHLFAVSIDEMYYNPVQVEEVIRNLSADQSDTYKPTNWQYARGALWSRSFWGVHSSGFSRGFLVNGSGQVGDDYVANEVAVAPAFYLDLEKVVMARSASNAAATSAASTGLKTYDAKNLGNSIKFLLQDKKFAQDFDSSINNKIGFARKGATYEVDYSGASTSALADIDAGTGSKLVISGILYDKDGKIVYYGPLKELTDETQASGNVNITIPSDITAGEYTLALFEEQLGGTSTYNTGTNTKNNNGITFTGKEYKAYESDYQSGSVVYMSLNIGDDYHTDVNLTNNNEKKVKVGETLTVDKISGTFTSHNGTMNDSVSKDNVYIIAASDWDNNKIFNNPQLAKKIVVPKDTNGTFKYYIVIKDSYSQSGSFVKEYTVEVSDNGINNIKDALENSGYEVDPSLSEDEVVIKIIEIIKEMNNKINSLSSSIGSASGQIYEYSKSLDTIYNKLTESSFETDKISNTADKLSAIIDKIQDVDKELTEAKLEVTEINSKLDKSEDKVTQLQKELNISKGNIVQKDSELRIVKESIQKLQSLIKDKDSKINDLKKENEVLSSSADGFKMTVDTANTLFDITVEKGASNTKVLTAIKDYVKTKTKADKTIASIQKLINSKKTGDKLVEEVEKAIEKGVQSNSIVKVEKSSVSYKAGEKEGYKKGTDVGYNKGKKAGIASVDTKSYYSKGYKEGYKKATSKLGGNSVNINAERVIQRTFPIDTNTKADNQVAQTEIKKDGINKVTDIKTNADSFEEVTSEQQDKAYEIITYYMNHLEELGSLEDSEIREVATDKTKKVIADGILSYDFKPSKEQQRIIDKGEEDVNLTIDAKEIEDGVRYLVVHESKVRKGTYDVLITRAIGSKLLIKLQDLSPITVAKISIGKSDDNYEPEKLKDTVKTGSADEEISKDVKITETSTKDSGMFGIVMCGLIVVVTVIGLVVAGVLIRKKKKSSF